jgi:polysaccharide export outer membrane protein
MNKQITPSSVSILIALMLFLTSCVNTKNVAYFQNLSAAQASSIDSTSRFIEPKIQADDILSIFITTIDPSNAMILNQGSPVLVAGASSNISTQEINGYIVDKNGEIELALIGKVKVQGLTSFEAKELIRTKASEFYKKPTVNLRFVNFRVSVLGEVNRPATYTMPNERVSILDVISLAGDLTLYGKRENVLIVRQNGFDKEFGRINLNSSDLFKSPYYFLKQNDVVYIEPSKAKVSALNAPTRQSISIVLSAVSVLVLAFSRLL